ncbi:MAG: FHIPEP family type III secretion protein [Pseudomonadota bacterium]
MSQTDRRSPRSDIAIRVSDRIADTSDRRAIGTQVRRYARRMLAELQVPGDVRVSVRGIDISQGADAADTVRLRINGVACRLPFTPLAALESGVDAISRQIMQGIAVNRCEFITPAVVGAVVSAMFDKRDTRTEGLGSEHLLVIADALVGLCHGLGKLADLPATTHKQSTDARSLAEAIAGNPRNLSIRVEYSEDYAAIYDASVFDALPVAEMSDLMRTGMYDELGLLVPQVEWRALPTLDDRTFRIRLVDLVLPDETGLSTDSCLADLSVSQLESLFEMQALAGRHPIRQEELGIVTVDNAQALREADVFVWGPFGYMVLTIGARARDYPGVFVVQEIVQNSLNALGDAFPKLVSIAMERYDIATLTQILRELAEDRISILDQRTILQTLLLIDGTTDVDLASSIVCVAETEHLVPSKATDVASVSIERLSDYVRSFGLREQVLDDASGGVGRIPNVLLVDGETRARFRDSATNPLDHRELAGFVAEIGSWVESGNYHDLKPILIVDFEARRHIRDATRIEFPTLRALAFQEVGPTGEVKILGTIGIPSNP